MATVPNITQLVHVPLLSLLRKRKALRPPTAFVLAAAGVLLGLFCFTAIAARTPSRASIAMVLLPAFLSLSNGRERIRRAVAGVSGASQLLRASGEDSSYDQHSDVQTEYGYFYGDLPGYVLGIFLFVANESFF